jgi:pimeloyl-ACP methyl ester carboxylesterase
MTYFGFDIPFNLLFVTVTASYHAIASRLEATHSPPPGQLIEIEGRTHHLYTQGSAAPGQPTIVFDHSLGGIEGYLLVDRLAELTRVCIADRPGYGWSPPSPRPRTSENIVQELDQLLTTAGIAPPYLLVGDSFGSYNLRLYAHTFPKKVMGMVLTDGLHESGMLHMPLSLQLLKAFFTLSFGIAQLGGLLGVVRFLGLLGLFERLKPELRQCSPEKVGWIKRSFYRRRHWTTMTREMLDLNTSGRQLEQAAKCRPDSTPEFGDLPIINIKASNFLRPRIGKLGVSFLPADRLRDQMHDQLLKLSSHCERRSADGSSHFVWVDRPDVIIAAVRDLMLE